MWDLGQVIGVLLDPPIQGFALLREEREDQVHSYQVAWRTEQALQPGRWYLREQTSTGHSTSTSDGVAQRSFQGLKLVEQATGRPDYWPPPLHLLLPLKAGFWGRSGDDWRMLADVRTDQELATVRLSHRERRNDRALLLVDMERRILIRYERPSSALTLVAINTTLLWDGRGDSVARRVSNEQWVPAEPQAPPGTLCRPARAGAQGQAAPDEELPLLAGGAVATAGSARPRGSPCAPLAAQHAGHVATLASLAATGQKTGSARRGGRATPPCR